MFGLFTYLNISGTHYYVIFLEHYSHLFCWFINILLFVTYQNILQNIHNLYMHTKTLEAVFLLGFFKTLLSVQRG